MARALPPDQALIKATVDGKYAMLLHQFKVPGDFAQHKDFADLGKRDLMEYGQQKELTPGYWVYVYPYWYVWRDTKEAASPKRSYGPEQVTGQPDVAAAGDSSQAWCSQTDDGQDEWLLCEYARPIVPTAVAVYANYNPGSLGKITVFGLDGVEVEVWSGEDPTPHEDPFGISVIPIQVNVPVQRIKVYLRSIDTPSWNEIDAVGISDAAGVMHWSTAVAASSTYATSSTRLGFDSFIVGNDGLAERLESLEKEVRELKELIKAKPLEAEVKELKEILKGLKEMLEKKGKE